MTDITELIDEAQRDAGLEEERERLYRELQVLADVRTLDDWEDNHPTIGTIRIERRRHGHVALIADDFNAVIELPAKNRTEARAKAAAWVRREQAAMETAHRVLPGEADDS